MDDPDDEEAPPGRAAGTVDSVGELRRPGHLQPGYAERGLQLLGGTYGHVVICVAACNMAARPRVAAHARSPPGAQTRHPGMAAEPTVPPSPGAAAGRKDGRQEGQSGAG